MPADVIAGYGLARPTVADVLVTVHRLYGPNAADVWTRLLAAAGLAGHETDSTALIRLLDAMTGLDRISRISARSLQVRLRAYDSMTAAQQTSTDHRTAGSTAR